MKIVVCVKRVPDTEAVINVDPRTKKLIMKDIQYVLNPYDEYAVEEAIKLKEKFEGEVVVIGLGPPETEEVLRICLAMGADRAITVADDLIEKANAYTTAYVLAAAIKQQDYDLILCGKRSLDNDNGQFGTNLSEMLCIANVSAVTSIKLANDSIEVIRHIEGGSEKVELSLPCVLSAERGLNQPRFPSVVSVLKAKKRKIENINLEDIGIEKKDIEVLNSKTSILRYALPKPRKSKILDEQKGLSAEERMQMVMSGGITQKSESNLLWGEESKVVLKIIDEIEKLIA